MFDVDKTDEQMRAESQTRRAAVRAKLDAATTEKEARDALYGQSVAQLERILRDLGGNPTPGAGDVSLKRSIAARVLEGKAAPSAPAASTEAKMTQATAAQRRVPRLFEADDEREAIEALHARGRADLRRIADEIGAPIVPGSSETRMKEQIARHVLKLDQGYDERDNLLMEAQRRGIDVKPTDSMDTLRRNVRPVGLRDLPVGATDADRNRLMPRIPGESDLAYQLRNAPSDDYALRVLNGYSVAGLRAIARDENVAVRSGASKPDLVNAIMEIRRRWRDSMAVSR